jgi:SAM-dependent methyltransferase
MLCPVIDLPSKVYHGIMGRPVEMSLRSHCCGDSYDESVSGTTGQGKPMRLSLDRQNAYRERYRRRRPGWRPATEVYEALIREHLRPDMRILDIGCGRGGVLEQLGELVARPLGVDPDLDSLRQSRLPDLPRAAAFSDHLPFPDGGIDLVLSSWVFEHLANPAQTFGEIRRVLKPGGRAIFLTPNARNPVVLLNRLLRPLQSWLVPRLYGRAEADTFPVHYRANTRARLTRLAAGAGLNCERLLLIEDPTYLAFTSWLFRLSMTLARLGPPIHLVGVLAK